MEEAVCWARHRRTATTSDLGGGEPKAEAAGRRPEPRQEDAAGRALKKTLRPVVQHVLGREMQAAYRVAERRACRVLGFSRVTYRYRSRLSPRADLRGTYCSLS